MPATYSIGEKWKRNKKIVNAPPITKEGEPMEPKIERVTVAQAAKEMGMNAQAVRERMRRKEIDIGDVYKSIQKTGRKQSYRYYIYRNKLDAYIKERSKNC